MTESQKDERTLESTGKQNQGQSDQRTSINPSSKPSEQAVENEDDDQLTGSEKEHRDTEHQHEYKTPVGKPGNTDENQRTGQDRNTTPEMNQNQKSNQDNNRTGNQIK